MKLLAILVAASLICVAAEAKPKTKAKKPKKAADLTSSELHSAAVEELAVPTQGKAVKPMATSPDDALVSTAEALRQEAQEPYPASEVEFGAQSYHPVGTGTVAAGETYSYDRLSAKPMVLVGGRHWFYQRLRTSAPWRVGAALQAGFSRNSLSVQTTRGFVYNDVHLNSFLVLVGPETEYFLGAQRRFGLGIRLAAGRLLASQSATNTSITQSQSATSWEAGVHLRYQPSSGFFVKLGFARRSNFGDEQDLRVQQNNYEALAGFAM